MWLIIFFIIFVFCLSLYKLFVPNILDGNKKNCYDLRCYERKPYLFDTNSEFQLYKILVELFSTQYWIFPQINYSHLIIPKRSFWSEERRLRSRIDRKSADFILCDKEKVIPRIIIELDGNSHNNFKKQKRDKLIDELTRTVGIPIIHLDVYNLNKEFIKMKIDQEFYSIPK